ncbi:hypothetical protein [Anthocerotibacter panamensis]|uniref:hypothetical protein n=1 Tax=Anthocerotibacter panamensis TaxID=2857077 RepID=UPI001C407FC5|nr:hypothetical protein [Anthocerotibacter panamensis]
MAPQTPKKPTAKKQPGKQVKKVSSSVLPKTNLDLLTNAYSAKPNKVREIAQKSIAALIEAAKKIGITNKAQIAYILATAEGEAQLGNLMREGWIPSQVTEQRGYDAAGNNLGNTINKNPNENYTNGDGYRFRGRGFVQVTGRAHYQEWSKKLNLEGVDLTENPEKLEDPAIAAEVAARGMLEGSFTKGGRSLKRYLDSSKIKDDKALDEAFLKARTIINGDGAKNGHSFAGKARKYYDLIKDMDLDKLYDLTPEKPVQPPIPTVQKMPTADAQAPASEPFYPQFLLPLGTQTLGVLQPLTIALKEMAGYEPPDYSFQYLPFFAESRAALQTCSMPSVTPPAIVTRQVDPELDLPSLLQEGNFAEPTIPTTLRDFSVTNETGASAIERPVQGALSDNSTPAIPTLQAKAVDASATLDSSIPAVPSSVSTPPARAALYLVRHEEKSIEQEVHGNLLYCARVVFERKRRRKKVIYNARFDNRNRVVLIEGCLPKCGGLA